MVQGGENYSEKKMKKEGENIPANAPVAIKATKSARKSASFIFR